MRAPAWAARQLLRAARVGTLATAAGGQPFASLVTPATAPDLSLLLLLSDLAEHTRHLRADPRCAVLVTGTAPEANPQTAPRVTVSGIAEITDDPVLRARYLTVHPYAAQYAGFGDFCLWRLRPAQAHYVGGFARAARLGPEELAPDPAALAAIAVAEAELLAWGGPELIALDVDGCDVTRDGQVARIAWSAPAADVAAVRRELARLGVGRE